MHTQNITPEELADIVQCDDEDLTRLMAHMLAGIKQLRMALDITNKTQLAEEMDKGLQTILDTKGKFIIN